MDKPPSSRSDGQQAFAAEWCHIDAHRYRIEEDIIHWHFVGEVTLEHVQRGIIATESIYERYGYCLSLMNAGRVAKMSAEARRFLGEQSKRRDQMSASAIYNAGVMGIAISLLIAGASRLFSGKEPSFCIVKTEDDARSWLSKQRQRMGERSAA